MKLLGFVLSITLIFILSFGITSSVVYGICWAFGLNFTWKIAIGIWLVLYILKSIFKSNK